MNLNKKILLNKRLNSKMQNKNTITNEEPNKIIRSNKSKFPLSKVQMGIWLDCKRNKSSLAYNIPFACKIKGDVNIKALKLSLKNIITCNESWHSVIRSDKDNLYQEICKDIILDFTYYDISKEKLDDFLIADRAKQFVAKKLDLENGPLVRFALFQSKNASYFIMSIHHIIYDGSTQSIFCKKLSLEYESIINNKNSSLKSSSISYGDYVEYCRSKDKSENMDKQIKYWSKELENLEVTEFLVDNERKTTSDNSSSIEYFEFDNTINECIRDYAIIHKCTVNGVLFSAFVCLLFLYSRNNSVTIGTTVNTRDHKQVEDMLGCFINNLIIKADILDDMTFDEVVVRVQNKLFMAYANKDIPLYELEKINLTNDNSSRNPFYSVAFNYNPHRHVELNLSGCQCEMFRLGEFYSLVDINFQVFDDKKTFTGFVEYNKSIYNKETIKNILNRFKMLLDKYISNSSKKIKEIELVSKEEKYTILEKFNNKQMNYEKNKCIAQIFEEQVKKTPKNTAIVYENQKLSYEKLNEKVNIVAHKLRDIGVRNDDLVVMLTKRSIEMIVGILSIIKSSGAYVPIDPSYPIKRIVEIIKDCSPKAILIYEFDDIDEIQGMINSNITILDLGKINTYKKDIDNLSIINKPSDLAYCIYTSGTSGKAKGVLIEQSGLINLGTFYINKHKINEKDKILMFANYVFDASVTEIAMALFSGACMYIVSESMRTDTTRLSNYINEQKISIALLPPIILEKTSIKGLRLLISAGSKANKKIIKENVASVYSNDYGPTEASVCASSWQYKYDSEIPYRIPIGKPINNKEIYIMRGNNLCGIGIAGELCIAGHGLARGYLNNDELSKEKFVDNPYKKGKMYHSGDLARWTDTGDIEYLGRIDEQVKIRGFRIELSEIKNKILELDKIKECALIAKKDTNNEMSIYAYFVKNTSIKNNDIRIYDIKDYLKNTLPSFMIPTYMMELESIPMTKNGKLDVRRLPDIKLESGRMYVAPRNDIEEMISNVWCDTLGIDRISVYDSFFELGGHSLLAIKLISKVNDEMTTSLTYEEFFRSKMTIEDMAIMVEKEILTYLSDEEFDD